jgi:cytochrome c oxidase assembly protein subunit 15
VQVTPRRFRQIAIGALWALVIVIVAGAGVRLTDSGLGCDDWPRCNSARIVDVSSKHAAIEQVNRLFNGIITVFSLALVLGARALVPRRPDLTRLAWTVVLLVAANAVLGGISVKVDLHPIAIQAHLLLALVAVVFATVLVRRAGDRRPAAGVSAPARRLTWLLAGLTIAAMFTGTVVTGAGPHAGDAEAERLDVSIPDVARIHGATVMATLAIALLLAWRIRGRRADAAVLTSALSTWLFVGMLQAAVGYVQYFNDVPALLVGVHVAGATALTWATTQLVLEASCGRPVHEDLVSESEAGLVSRP